MRKLKFKTEKGFTLIELVIVTAILGIFFAALLNILNPLEQFSKANDARRKSDLGQIQKALESYYQDNGRYPKQFSSTDYRIQGKTGVIPWGGTWQPYINVVPKDPGKYQYVYYSPDTSYGQTYYLFASLDRKTDPQTCFKNGNKCTNAPGSKACIGECDYGVSSPNVSP